MQRLEVSGAIRPLYSSLDVKGLILVAVRQNKTGSVLYGTIEARSCNHCCRTKAIGVTHSEFVLVDLGIQRAIRMRYVVTCGLPSLHYFPHYLS